MRYIIDFDIGIDLAILPESEEMATMQNLYCMLNTTLAEVPCYREYGISKEYLSCPINVAKSMIVVAVSEALDNFFPELKLVNTSFTNDPERPDKLIPRFEVTDNE